MQAIAKIGSDTCPTCGDRREENHFGLLRISKPCSNPECVRVRDTREALRRSQLNEARRTERLDLMQLPKAARSVRWSNRAFVIDVNNRKAVESLKTFTGRNCQSCFIWGGSGVGKTHMVHAMLNELTCVDDYPAPVMYFTERGLFRWINDGIRSKDLRDSYDRRRTRVEGCGLLVLDDLGSELINESRYGVLFGIADRRTLDGLPTVITCNYSLADLAGRFYIQHGKVGAEKFISRLAMLCEVIKVGGRDRRMRA